VFLQHCAACNGLLLGSWLIVSAHPGDTLDQKRLMCLVLVGIVVDLHGLVDAFVISGAAKSTGAAGNRSAISWHFSTNSSSISVWYTTILYWLRLVV